ncbi:MAG: thymidylate synthase [Candidatus Sedimenticola sp. (ex Thyasira tokunagai)]
MPRFFEGETADTVWRLAAKELLNSSELISQTSRLGSVREVLHANWQIQNPRQRWVHSREPAFNPAFAIAEVIWIICGRNDSEFLNYWNPVLPKFAGSGDLYHGAYGHRLKHNLDLDQLKRAYQVLSVNPDSRQVVLQIWDGRIDLPHSNGAPAAADIPCNICSMLNIRGGRLEWTQIMRSNDLFLGVPHNFVQFTSLQEVLAGWLGIEVGSYVQISNSLHFYEHDLENYHVSETAANITNTDDLSLPKKESDSVMMIVEQTMDRLRAIDLNQPEFISLLDVKSIPEGYRNMISIVAADSARRRGWGHEMEVAVDINSNPALSHAWERWLKRMTH